MRKFLILFIFLIAFSGYGWLGEGCVCEQWVYEYRVDSIYVTQMDNGDGRGVDLVTVSNEGTEIDNLFLQLNANGEYWFYDLDEITCDSARIDSINWQLNIVTVANADTVLIGYIDPMGGTCVQVSFVTTDTIIKSSAVTCWDTTLVFDKKINKSNKRYFPYLNLLDTSNKIYISRLILYYEAYNKRYGIPN